MLIKASPSWEASPDAQRQDRKGDYRRTLQGSVCVHTHRKHRVTTLIGNKGVKQMGAEISGVNYVIYYLYLNK